MSTTQGRQQVCIPINMINFLLISPAEGFNKSTHENLSHLSPAHPMQIYFIKSLQVNDVNCHPTFRQTHNFLGLTVYDLNLQHLTNNSIPLHVNPLQQCLPHHKIPQVMKIRTEGTPVNYEAYKLGQSWQNKTISK